jgi:hypothetical protein
MPRIEWSDGHALHMPTAGEPRGRSFGTPRCGALALTACTAAGLGVHRPVVVRERERGEAGSVAFKIEAGHRGDPNPGGSRWLAKG